MPVRVYTGGEIGRIGEAGGLVARALRSVGGSLREHETTREVADRLGDFVRERGGRPALEGFREGGGPAFDGPACVCVNEEAANAVPSERLLRAGDLVTLDLAVELDGWFADGATTVVVGGVGEDGEGERLRRAGNAVLRAAIGAIGPGRAWSSVVGAAGLAAAVEGVLIVPGLDGHGIGRGLHEGPACPLVPGPGFRDFVLWPGMVLTVEPVVVAGAVGPGSVALVGLDDGWTVVTGSLERASGEERTVAVTVDGRRVLTPIGE